VLTIDQLTILGFAVVFSLIIGIFLGYRYGKNVETSNPNIEFIAEEAVIDHPDTDESHEKNLRIQLVKKMDDLKKNIKTDFVGLAIYDVMTDEIRWRLAIGATNQRYKRIVIRMGKGIAGEVIQLNRPIKVNHFPIDLEGDPIEYPILLIEHLKSVLAVPVSFREKIYGVLLVGQREERIFTDIEEKEVMAISKDIAKELERANVYDRILKENEDGESESLDLNLYKHDLIQYLKDKRKKAMEEKRGKIDFEILDQSITQIPTDLLGTLIQSMDVIFLTINKNNEDQINISIGREGNQLLVDCKSNHSIDSTRDVFGELYDRIGNIGGSIQSYREDYRFHLVIQVPLSSFKNPI